MELSAKAQLVDANVWIAYFDKDDSLSEQGRDLLKQTHAESRPLLLTDFIIQEVLTIFLYKNKITYIEKFLNYIETQPHIEIIGIDGLLWKRVTQFMRRHKHIPKLSFTDWSLLYLATAFGFGLDTFDKQLNTTYQRLSQ